MKLFQKQSNREKEIKCKNCESTNFQEPELVRLNERHFKMVVFCNDCKHTINYIFSNGNEILKIEK